MNKTKRQSWDKNKFQASLLYFNTPLFNNVGTNFSITMLFLILVRDCLINMINRDLIYLFIDKSLTTYIMFINPVIFNGEWQPEGKIFPLLDSVLLCQLYFHLCNFIMLFIKHSSAQSYHLFDHLCRSVVQWGDQQQSPECKQKLSTKPLDFFSSVYLLTTYAIHLTRFYSSRSIS